MRAPFFRATSRAVGASNNANPERLLVGPNAESELTLEELLDGNYLLPGDLLDPIDPDWEVDAVITEERTIRINGDIDFGSLDEAAQHLNVTNLSGFEFLGFGERRRNSTSW